MKISVFRRVAVLAVGVLALAACAGDATSSESETTAEAAGQPTAEPETPSGESSEPGGDQEWDGIVEAAQGEGSVTLYASLTPANVEALEEAFETEYPEIDLQVNRAIDADLTPKLEAEFSTGRGTADVFETPNTPFIEQNSDRLVEVIRGPGLLDDAYEATAEMNESAKAPLIGGYFITYGWNTEAVPDGLDSLSDVLAPEFGDGRIGILTPSSPATVAYYEYLTEQYGEDFLPGLADQNPRQYPSGNPMVQSLTAGEIDIDTFTQDLSGQADEGLPVASAVPDRPFANPLYATIPDTAPHPNAAQVLIDFMVTPTGQEAINRGSTAALDGLDGPVATLSESYLPDLSQYTPDVVREYIDEWKSLFD